MHKNYIKIFKNSQSPSSRESTPRIMSKQIEMIVKAFQEWRDFWKDTRMWVVLRRIDNETGEIEVAVKDVSPERTQRYFPEGRRMIIRRLASRLDRRVMSGVHLVLEFDPHRFDLVEAWKVAGQKVREFLDKVNKVRCYRFEKTMRRLGVRGYRYRRLQYVWVLEEHKSGYPHIHVWFPGLNWLLDVEKLRDIWGCGFVWVNKVSGSAASYVTKYIRKLNGWSDVGLSMLWNMGCRMYCCSRRLYLVRIERRWRRVGFALFLLDLERLLRTAGVSNPDLSGDLSWRVWVVKKCGDRSSGMLLSSTALDLVFRLRLKELGKREGWI